MYNPYVKTKFVLTAASIQDLPKDQGVEMALLGRSNCGKSTLINSLAQKRQLARASKTPGRTQNINIFEIEDNIRIADMPGYGYAQVSKKEQLRWISLINDYFRNRISCRLVNILMDIRRPMQASDIEVLQSLKEINLKFVIVLTKSDKLSKSKINEQIINTKNIACKIRSNCHVMAISSKNRQGLMEYCKYLDEHFLPLVNQ